MTKIIAYNTIGTDKANRIEIARKVLAVVDAGLSGGLGRPIPGEMCVEAAVCYALGLPHGDNPTCVASSLRSFKIALNDALWSSKQVRAKGLRRLALVQLVSADNLDEVEFSRRLVLLAITIAVPAALRSAAAVCPDIEHTTELMRHATICENVKTIDAAADAADAADAAARAARAARARADEAADYAADAAARAAAYADEAADYAADAAARAAAYAAEAAAHAAAYAADAAARAATYAVRAAAYAARAPAYAAEAAADAARDEFLAMFAESAVQILVDMGVPGVQWLDLAPTDK